MCYDIPVDRRRSRVQRSVFECDLTPVHLQRLKGKLDKVIKPEDSLRYYYLCVQCLPKVEVVNGPPVEKAQLYFMV